MLEDSIADISRSPSPNEPSSSETPSGTFPLSKLSAQPKLSPTAKHVSETVGLEKLESANPLAPASPIPGGVAAHIGQTTDKLTDEFVSTTAGRVDSFAHSAESAIAAKSASFPDPVSPTDIKLITAAIHTNNPTLLKTYLDFCGPLYNSSSLQPFLTGQLKTLLPSIEKGNWDCARILIENGAVAALFTFSVKATKRSCSITVAPRILNAKAQRRKDMKTRSHIKSLELLLKFTKY